MNRRGFLANATAAVGSVAGISAIGAVGGNADADYFEHGSVSLDLHPWSNGRVAAVMEFRLNDVSADADGPKPNDRAILAYESDAFSFVGGSVEHRGSVTARQNLRYDDVTRLVSLPTVGTPANAVIVELQDGLAKEVYGMVQIVLEKQKSAGRVAAKFVHAWSLFDSARVSGALDVSVSPVGGISVSAPALSDTEEYYAHDRV